MRDAIGRNIRIVGFITLFFASTCHGGEGLQKISDSVYAYVGVAAGTPGNAFSANAGIVIGENGVLVVDTLTSAGEARQFYSDIRKVTEKPIKYVVNTHNHLDHAFGNSFFADLGAHIISHKKCKEVTAASAEKMMANPGMFGLPEDFWKDTRSSAAEITFSDEMIVDLGGVSAAFIHGGTPSHSAGSIIVVVEAEDVMFAGDILFTDFHPYVGEGDFDGWQETLDMMMEKKITRIIPGHGPLSSNRDLADMKEYLKIFDTNAKRLAGESQDPEEITGEMMKILPQKTGGGFIVGMNIQMRYLAKD